MLQNRIQECGETKEECRKRVLRTCLATWKTGGSNGDALRREWQLKAVQTNTTIVKQGGSDNATQVVLASSNDGDSGTSTYIAPLALYGGFGSLGVGDQSFGISPNIVAKADEEAGFVQRMSASWKTRSAGQTSQRPVDPVGTTRLSCLETFGFCKDSIAHQDKYEQLVSHLVKFVADYRKLHLVCGRNKGPSARIQIPLLFAISGNLSQTNVTWFFVFVES